MAAGVVVRWYGEQFIGHTKGQLIAMLNAWYITFRDLARENASVKATVGKRGQSARSEKEYETARLKAEIGYAKRVTKKGLFTESGRKRRVGKPSPFKRKNYYIGSKPHLPPARRTGFGRKNIVGGRMGLVARVGYTKEARYMTYHELGIKYRKAGFQQRPALKYTVNNSMGIIVSAIRKAIRTRAIKESRAMEAPKGVSVRESSPAT